MHLGVGEVLLKPPVRGAPDESSAVFSNLDHTMIDWGYPPSLWSRLQPGVSRRMDRQLGGDLKRPSKPIYILYLALCTRPYWPEGGDVLFKPLLGRDGRRGGPLPTATVPATSARTPPQRPQRSRITPSMMGTHPPLTTGPIAQDLDLHSFSLAKYPGCVRSHSGPRKAHDKFGELLACFVCF